MDRSLRGLGVVKSLQPPAYGHTKKPSVMLLGTHTAERTIRLVYNPDPACDISSKTTVYSFNVSLFQTHSILSPSAPPGTRLLIVNRRVTARRGKTPELHRVHPEPTFPALWRSKAAGGTDEDVLLVDLVDRVEENDFWIRPSTLPRYVRHPQHYVTRYSVITPIRAYHYLDIDTYFPVYGKGPRGEPMRYAGPGGLQIMRVRRRTMLPPASSQGFPQSIFINQQCSILPKTVNLPSCELEALSRSSNALIPIAYLLSPALYPVLAATFPFTIPGGWKVRMRSSSMLLLGLG
jgi:hypothetical protein